MILLPNCTCCGAPCQCGECQTVVMDWSITTASGLAYSGTSESLPCSSSLSYDAELGFIASLEYGGANLVNVSDLDRPSNDGSNIVASSVFRCGPNFGLNPGEWLVDVTLVISTRVPLPGGGFGGPPLDGVCVWSGIVTKCDKAGGFPKVPRSALQIVSSSGTLGAGGCANFLFTFRAVP